MRTNPLTLRCPVCAAPWREHPDTCSRHPYRPTIRRDSEGRDVSEMPGLWDESDTFHCPEVKGGDLMTDNRFFPLELRVVASSRSEAEEDRLDAIARLRAHRSLWWWLTAPVWERRAVRHALMVLEVTR